MTAKNRERHGAGGADAGDPVCRAHRLSSECGAMPTAGMPDRSQRCRSPTNDSDGRNALSGARTRHGI
jgi:hypothetical protein